MAENSLADRARLGRIKGGGPIITAEDVFGENDERLLAMIEMMGPGAIKRASRAFRVIAGGRKTGQSRNLSTGDRREQFRLGAEDDIFQKAVRSLVKRSGSNIRSIDDLVDLLERLELRAESREMDDIGRTMLKNLRGAVKQKRAETQSEALRRRRNFRTIE